MIVIHALWRPGARLALWAEDTDAEGGGESNGSDAADSARRDTAHRVPRQSGRRRNTEDISPPPHPFAASADTLAALPSVIAAKAAAGSATVWLPTRAGRPLDSPELIREELPGQLRGAVTLAGWRVYTLEYDADEALTLLTDLHANTDAHQPDTLRPDTHRPHKHQTNKHQPDAHQVDTHQVVVGGSVRHLLDVAVFVGDLVARGRVLPTIVTEGDSLRAQWLPVLTGADAAWAQALTLALPPAGRAGAANDDAAMVVANMIDVLVDATARAALEPMIQTRSGAPAAWRSWLHALTGRQRSFTADPGAVNELVQALAAWQRDAVAGRVRALFRLVEPPESPDGPDIDAGTGSGRGRRRSTRAKVDDDAWRLEFALQAADEPSLVVAADHVWRSRGGLKVLARQLDAPQETLLGELGRACRVYPALEQALRTAKPAALELDGAGAHQFLREGAPTLAGAGFGVLLPGWWGKPRARLGARLSATSRTAPGMVAGTSMFGLDSIVDYRWELALGDEPLSPAELAALTALKSPLVRLRGQWVELDAKRLAAGLKMITDGAQMSVADLLHAGLNPNDGPGGLPVVSVTATGPLGDLLSGQAERRIEPMPAPPGFQGTLRPYQERGLAWLAFLESLGLGPILADSMGLGKTVQLLALLQQEWEAPERPGPTLLVCPMSLVGNWQREAAKFAPDLRVHVHHGAERAKGKQFAQAVANADLVLTTYALASRDSAALAEITWHRLVLDEAQAIKNAATRQATAVRALPARHKIAVTGTPVENRLADLWSIMEFANPGLLGNATSFKNRYAEPIERHGNEEAAERLKRLTGPFVLRREKTDKSIISDLPDKIEMEVVCNLTAEQASLYQAVLDDMMTRIEESEGIERRGLVLATMTKLKQVCNHPAHLLRDGTRLAGRSGKLARLEEILDEILDDGEKALLFTQYAEFGGMLRSYLAARFGREVIFLHGGVAKAERDAMVARFQSETEVGPSLFVLSLKAGGTGLTLTAANHVIHVDRWWNPAVEDQATDRAFRIGQRRNVQVRKFVCAGTMEEKISAMIRDKRGLAAKIVGGGEQWLTEMSTSQLRDLFALEAGAVVE